MLHKPQTRDKGEQLTLITELCPDNVYAKKGYLREDWKPVQPSLPAELGFSGWNISPKQEEKELAFKTTETG